LFCKKFKWCNSGEKQVGKTDLIRIVGRLAVEKGLLERFLQNPRQAAKETEPGLTEAELLVLEEEAKEGTIQTFVENFGPVEYNEYQDKSR
jgi:hypothetical protein